MSKEKYLIGIDKDGNFVYLEQSTWDCDWYWSGGYVEEGHLETFEEAKRRAEEDDEVKYYWKESDLECSLADFKKQWVNSYLDRLEIIEEVNDDKYIEWHCHTHFDSKYLKGNHESVKELFEITNMTDNDWWRLKELYNQFYKIRNCAEVFHRGSGLSSVQDDEKRDDLYNDLNKHLENVVIKKIDILLSKIKMDVEKAVQEYEK